MSEAVLVQTNDGEEISWAQPVAENGWPMRAFFIVLFEVNCSTSEGMFSENCKSSL